MLVILSVLLVAHLTVVVVVQRARLRDVRQVLPVDALGHRAELDSLADAVRFLPLSQITRQLMGQLPLELRLARVGALRRLEVVPMDVVRLQVDALRRQLLGDGLVVVPLPLAVVVGDPAEAVEDRPVTVVEHPLSLVWLSGLRNNKVRL